MKKKKIKPIKIRTINRIEIFKKKKRYLAIPILTKKIIKRFDSLDEAIDYAENNLDYIYKGISKKPVYKNDDLSVYFARDMDNKYYIVKKDGKKKIIMFNLRLDPCIRFVDNKINKKKLST